MFSYERHVDASKSVQQQQQQNDKKQKQKKELSSSKNQNQRKPSKQKSENKSEVIKFFFLSKSYITKQISVEYEHKTKVIIKCIRTCYKENSSPVNYIKSLIN